VSINILRSIPNPMRIFFPFSQHFFAAAGFFEACIPMESVSLQGGFAIIAPKSNLDRWRAGSNHWKHGISDWRNLWLGFVSRAA
jgi:hypothetical protein